MTARVSRWLQYYTPDRRVLQAELHNSAYFIGVDPSLNGSDQNDGQARLLQAFQGMQLQFQQIFSTNSPIGLPAQPVKLEVDDRVQLCQTSQEFIIPSNADPVGVQHHLAD